jgi:HK97 family phage major capsid protein
LLNIPVALTDGMPTIVDGSDNLVAGEYAAVVGDFRFYWIVDNEDVPVLRLAELYAEENEVGFQIWQETDGMAVLASAFYALKIKE